MVKKLSPITGRLLSARSDSEYDKIELSKGIRVEMEHTNSKIVAKRIAKHHLDEHPNYYTELYKMERKLKNK